MIDLIIASTLIASPAQDVALPQQTVAGAHLFIEDSARRGMLKYYAGNNTTTRHHSANGRIINEEIYEPVQIERMTRVSDCLSSMSRSSHPVTSHAVNGLGQRTTYTYHYIEEYNAVAARNIDWSRVEDVVYYRTFIYISFSDRPVMKIRARSVSDRMVWAMEFLRLNCDSSLSTGF